ncbi:MAG: hypothetical protein EA425_10800, partial [Puniceicoccaceae bacterium]
MARHAIRPAKISPAMPRQEKERLIVIGDVHGCIRELEILLAQLAPRPGDRIVFLGDLVNRGPDSHAVIEKVRHLGAIALLGNHERRLLRAHRTADDSLLTTEDRRTYPTLTDTDWAFLASMTLTHYEPSLDLVCVHGGFLPHLPWRQQGEEIVTRIQVVDKLGQARKRGESPNSPAWADLWRGPPFVVYGHTPRVKPYRT